MNIFDNRLASHLLIQTYNGMIDLQVNITKFVMMIIIIMNVVTGYRTCKGTIDLENITKCVMMIIIIMNVMIGYRDDSQEGGQH